MLRAGVDYGQTYPADFFEKHLRTKRDTMQFGLAVSEIRRGLEREGFYLSGRGQNGNQYIILQPENNMSVLGMYQRAALDALKRGVVLGTATRLDTLSPDDRAKHERILEKIATRCVLMRRSESIAKVIRKTNQALLE